MHRLLGTLLEVIAAVHEALIEYTMPYPEHMCNLMSHHCHRPVLYQVVVRFIFLELEEALIVSGERKDPGPLPDAG